MTAPKLSEQVDMVAGAQVADIVDRAAAEQILQEATGLSATLCSSMLASAVLDKRAAQKARDDARRWAK